MNNSQILESLSAGIASYNDESVKELVNKISEEFFKDADNKETVGFEDYEKLFSLIIKNGFAEKFADLIEPEDYFNLGVFFLNAGESGNSVRKTIHLYLDVFRRSEFLVKIYNDRKWDKLIEELIRKSNFRVKELFYQRSNFYGNKTLFNILEGEKVTPYSWKETERNIEKYAAALKTLLAEFNEDVKVAFLLENSLNMAWLDLACLTNGIVNIMIPGNAVAEHIEFILKQAEAKVIFVANENQLAKVKSVKHKLPDLKWIVFLSGSSLDEDVITFNEFLSYANLYDVEKDFYAGKDYGADSLATIMYTSGTTGEPKGIEFSYMNIVFKRFARAMAIPQIGDKDRYLSYLPLFHTFGRYLEMMGSVFWGAEYSFMENPSVETMIENMNLVKPTIFISIPKKWIQLYDQINELVDIAVDDDEEIKAAISKVTGGALKFGLSAAGYLPPDIFIFFQKYGVNLMSGFGMTEATGGITMTPIGEYYENSLGKALPGIELKLAEDGELLIRGAYVTIGYFKNEENTFDSGGWLPTGDIMKMDENGFIEIIDRKKEIYKNIKGETIAPQKIENLFRDFDFVKQVFLVGDHKLFNTVLIYPNYDSETLLSKNYNEEEMRDIFSSVVVTVNKFLAPFERIIDFRIIDRPFSAELGELTPKGTYKRRVIEKNFEPVIKQMYVKQFIELKNQSVNVRVPNWFLREKGKLSDDIFFENNRIKIADEEVELLVEKLDEGKFRIGDFVYEITTPKIDLQPFLTNPIYWVGNKALFDFCGEPIFQWYRNREPEKHIGFYAVAGKVESNVKDLETIKKLHLGGEKSLYGLNLAAFLIQSEDESEAMSAANYIKFLSSDSTLPIFKIVKDLAKRPQLTKHKSIRRELLKTAIHICENNRLDWLLEKYFKIDYDILDSAIMRALIERKAKDILGIIERLLNNTLVDFAGEELDRTPIPALFSFLEKYVELHPTSYRTIRRILVQYKIQSDRKEVSEEASKTRDKIRLGFRKWLGTNQRVAVDVETGDEYTWEDVVVYEENIEPDDLQRIKEALVETPLIREAIFFFSQGTVLRLDDILPSGIWISFYKKFSTHTSYRVSVQTRFHGSYNFTINLNETLSSEKVTLESDWLIIACSAVSGQKLTNKFGGYWEKYELWTEEYNPQENVGHYLERMSKHPDEKKSELVYHIWRFFVWNAATASLNFIKLSKYKLQLADYSPDNFIIPKHDYQVGTRLVSIEERVPYGSSSGFIGEFYNQFIAESVKKYPYLNRDSIWNQIYSGIISALGEVEGVEYLNGFKSELLSKSDFPDMENALSRLNSFLTDISDGVFIPKRLFFAINRFRRWLNLNEDASIEAQASMLNELYSTYSLNEMEKELPETRIKFYFETCFRDSSDEVKAEFKKIIKEFHHRKIKRKELLVMLSEIKAKFTLSDKEEYFLTRISYSHIRPEDSAQIMKIGAGGHEKENLIVEFFDTDGNPFVIRRPVTPKEISRLHRMFLDANLMVNFNSDHQFLVAVSSRGFIIGGLFYFPVDESRVHMDKIVVADPFRRKGISDILMKEFFNRMKNERYEYVTTGFFRPEYFYKFGFKVERKYSGLAKKL